MTYAKLVDGAIQYAPHKLRGETTTTYNPPAEMLEVEGYKPVQYTDPPGEPDEGYDWVEKWTETENAIVQGWEQIPIPDDVSADEAMDILFGGEDE